MPSSGMLRHVALVMTDVSEEPVPLQTQRSEATETFFLLPVHDMSGNVKGHYLSI
jgi:hypothetical protein